MRILVPIKRVLDYTAKIKPKSDGSGIDDNNIKWIVNPFDEIAVEEALRLREKGIAKEVVVLSIGNQDVQTQIRATLAMGADSGIHVVSNIPVDSDFAARIINAVNLEQKFDLIIMGKQGIDTDASQTASILSAISNLPLVSFASKIEINNSVKVTREVDGGLETLEFDLPGIITTDLRLNEPRYASLPGIMQAKKKQLVEIQLDSLNLDPKLKVETSNYTAPESRKAGKKYTNIDELIQVLKDNRVL